MRRRFLAFAACTVLGAAMVLSLYSEAGAAGVFGRKAFRATGDNDRNFVTLESVAPLETIHAVTSALTALADVRLDSIQDGAVLELSVDLSKITTGFPERNAVVFSRSFLDFGSAATAAFRLVELNKSRNWILNNEQKIEVNGTGELQLAGRTDTVSVELMLQYLEQNEITRGRLPGDLLHISGTFVFRLSDFGIRIPQEALLKLNDLIRIRFDIFASTQA